MLTEHNLISNLLTGGGIITSVISAFFLIWYFSFKAFTKLYSDLIKQSAEQFADMQKNFVTAIEMNRKHNEEIISELGGYIKEDYKAKAHIAEILTRLDTKLDLLITGKTTPIRRKL